MVIVGFSERGQFKIGELGKNAKMNLDFYQKYVLIAVIIPSI